MPEAAATAPPAPKPAKSAPQKAMEKLGLLRDIDLALHLPLRYEDETRITPIAALQEGEAAQVEGVVVDCQVEMRSRRQLLVRVKDESGTLLLRFLHFYPAQQKQMSAATRLRIRGEARASSGARWCIRSSRWSTRRRRWRKP
jgi:ATP-dependent DNA helicase RecG